MIYLLFAILNCIIEDEVFLMINKFRVQHKLLPLQKNKQLTAAAKIQAEHMKNTNTMTHFGKEGKNHTLLQRIQNSGYDHVKELGQYIILTNDDLANSVFNEAKIQNENDHYLENDFFDIGISNAKTKSGRHYWVLVFANKFDKDIIAELETSRGGLQL